jgi:hypothetical protein
MGHHDPLVSLFSAIANWAAAVLMSEHHEPELLWQMTLDGRRWRLTILVNGETVFAESSWNTWQLARDAERTFRAWADERDRKENEAKLEASTTELLDRRPT